MHSLLLAVGFASATAAARVARVAASRVVVGAPVVIGVVVASVRVGVCEREAEK